MAWGLECRLGSMSVHYLVFQAEVAVIIEYAQENLKQELREMGI